MSYRCGVGLVARQARLEPIVEFVFGHHAAFLETIRMNVLRVRRPPAIGKEAVWVYVRDVLDRLLKGCTDYHQLLPDVWKQSHHEAVREYRVEERRDKADRKQFRAAQRRLAARDSRRWFHAARTACLADGSHDKLEAHAASSLGTTAAADTPIPQPRILSSGNLIASPPGYRRSPTPNRAGHLPTESRRPVKPARQWCW